MGKLRSYFQIIVRFLGTGLVLKILSGMMLAFLMYGFIMLAISPRQTILISETNDKVRSLTPDERTLMADAEGYDLLKQKAYLISRVACANDDSIGLTMDLSSGRIALEIKGVILFERALIECSASPYFKKMPDSSILMMTASPHTVSMFRSTIVKEPIVEKMAPKDTSEVELTDFRIDTSYREPAFLVFVLDNGMEIVLKQYHGVSFRDQFKYGSFIFREKMNRIGHVLYALIRGKVPPYTPRITAELSAKDIRIIYRALPQHPRVSLRIL